VLIDWDGTTMGDAKFEKARTYFACKKTTSASAPNNEKITKRSKIKAK
jgi:hypothetical protein